LLDAYLGGFAPGRLIALGADTGVGKSLYVQYVANTLVKANVPVLVISTEMSNEEVMSRLAHMEAGWDRLAAYRAGEVSAVQRNDMLEAMDSLAGRPLYLCESRGMDAGQIGAEIRRQVRQHGIKVVVLDLLNGVPVKGDNRAQGIGAVTSALKAVAQAEGVCILMVAHINRDSAKLGELGLHSFKDSSAIEQDADQAMLLVPMADGVRLTREETQARIEATGMVDVMFRVVKNRFGSEGAVPMVLNWRLGGRFYARERKAS
jgi:replicative DNA helicase